MGNRRSSLLVKFGIIFVLFAAVMLGITDIATYRTQETNYRRQQQESLRNIASYLSMGLREDGRDFPMYQRYSVAHHQTMQVPADFGPRTSPPVPRL